MELTDISEIISKIKSKEGFIIMFNRNGFLVIDKEFISWEYVIQVVSGDKNLIRINDVGDFDVPPRFPHQDKRHVRE